MVVLLLILSVGLISSLWRGHGRTEKVLEKDKDSGRQSMAFMPVTAGGLSASA